MAFQCTCHLSLKCIPKEETCLLNTCTNPHSTTWTLVGFYGGMCSAQSAEQRVAAVTQAATTCVSTRLTLTPLVDKQRRRLSVGRFDPRRKQPSFVSLVPQVLIEVSISDLLKWLYVIHWDEMATEKERAFCDRVTTFNIIWCYANNIAQELCYYNG